MSIKAKIEAVIYAAEDPVTVDQMVGILKGLETPAEPVEGETAPAVDLKAEVKAALDELIADYESGARGMEIKSVAGGYRMSTRPEHHDVVRSFAKSLKPPIRLSLQALETLAVIAYKQPITAPEISEVRGVDSSGVLATLIDRKLITTAGRKQVIGRPILYKTTKEFLLRFGLKDVNELPSLKEFEEMAGQALQNELFDEGPVPDATGTPHVAEETAAPAEAAAPDGQAQDTTEENVTAGS